MIIIPASINKANEYLLRLAKLFQQKIKTEQACSNNTRGNQFRQSIKFNPPPLDVNSRNNTLGKTRNKSQNVK